MMKCEITSSEKCIKFLSILRPFRDSLAIISNGDRCRAYLSKVEDILPKGNKSKTVSSLHDIISCRLWLNSHHVINKHKWMTIYKVLSKCKTFDFYFAISGTLHGVESKEHIRSFDDIYPVQLVNNQWVPFDGHIPREVQYDFSEKRNSWESISSLL